MAVEFKSFLDNGVRQFQAEFEMIRLKSVRENTKEEVPRQVRFRKDENEAWQANALHMR